MTAAELGKRYGKRLVSVLEDADVYVVREVDEYGCITGQWGEGTSGKEALEVARFALDALHDVDFEGEARKALLDMARVLPSDVLREVLLERGDWHVEVKK